MLPFTAYLTLCSTVVRSSGALKMFKGQERKKIKGHQPAKRALKGQLHHAVSSMRASKRALLQHFFQTWSKVLMLPM